MCLGGSNRSRKSAPALLWLRRKLAYQRLPQCFALLRVVVAGVLVKPSEGSVSRRWVEPPVMSTEIKLDLIRLDLKNAHISHFPRSLPSDAPPPHPPPLTEVPAGRAHAAARK